MFTASKVPVPEVLIILFAIAGPLTLVTENAHGQSKRRLILDADTANEIDDRYAITRMLKQARFEVKRVPASA